MMATVRGNPVAWENFSLQTELAQRMLHQLELGSRRQRAVL
jgi:hypothetical protein